MNDDATHFPPDHPGRYYVLGRDILLRRLEEPMVYNVRTDDLFEVDDEAFSLLARCAEHGGIPEADVRDLSFSETCLSEGILALRNTPGAPRRRQSIDPAPVPSLRYLEVQITRRCNLSCGHCYLGEAEPRDLDARVFRRAVEDFDRLQGLRLLISGGEPLMHPSFEAINDVLGASPLRKVLLTNGLLLPRWLDRLNVHEVQVSIDGLEPSHDALRGAGTFTRAWDALEKTLEAGLDVSVATVVHKGNYHDLPRLEGLIRDLGLSEWNVDIPCPSGRWAENELTADEMAHALSFGFGGSLHGGGGAWTCGAHLMAITPEGRAAKCGFYGHNPVGPVEDGLAPLWERIPRDRLNTLRCQCSFIDECRGGCRFRAETAGDVHEPDPAKCALYGVPFDSGPRE